jgi:hypothetical protein
MKENNDDLEFNIQLERTLTASVRSIEGGSDKANEETKENTGKSGEQADGKFKIIDKLPKFLQGASHPGMCILQFIFKLSAVLCYIFLNLFMSNLVMVYIVVMVLSVFDFYVCKNITGR